MAKNITRRNFVGTMSCAAIGYSTLYNSLINLKAINALAASNSDLDPDYKALVCILKSGGNDSFNMLVPTTNNEYKEYQETRSNLALQKSELLALQTLNTPGREFGLHPALKGLQQLYNKGNVSFISNIGTLFEPVTKQKFIDQTAKLPLGLFSHSDQIQQWQTAIPNDRSAVGWGGRIADLVRDMNSSNDISMNFSLSGTNLFQEGKEVIEYVLDPQNGSIGITGHTEEPTRWDYFNNARTHAIDTLLDHQYLDIFHKTYIDVIRVGRDSHKKFQDALETVGDLKTTFPDSELGRALNMVARSVAAQKNLGFKRQIFFIDFYGWDHHDEVLENQNEMFTNFDTSLSSFFTALEEINATKQVTAFTISEFGRSLTSNGNGTDHAWGGNVMVLGGGINGSRIFGEYPSLRLDAEQNVYDGILIPTTPTDLYFAELALWMGVSPNDLSYVFPNISTFYNINSGRAPIGFLNI